jgi:hypothetical protein
MLVRECVGIRLSLSCQDLKVGDAMPRSLQFIAHTYTRSQRSLHTHTHAAKGVDPKVTLATVTEFIIDKLPGVFGVSEGGVRTQPSATSLEPDNLQAAAQLAAGILRVLAAPSPKYRRDCCGADRCCRGMSWNGESMDLGRLKLLRVATTPGDDGTAF